MITSNEPGRVFDGADMGGVEVAPISVPQEVPGIQKTEEMNNCRQKVVTHISKITGNHRNQHTCMGRMPLACAEQMRSCSGKRRDFGKALSEQMMLPSEIADRSLAATDLA